MGNPDQYVKIQYGIFGGERLGKRLRKALHQAGYRVTKDAKQADIIIAHSAGCFWLPPANPRQQIILIDPPYWPGRTIRERAHARTQSNWHFYKRDYSLCRWLAKNLWGTFYAIFDHQRTRQITRFAPNYDLAADIRGRRVILVRNEHDDWLTNDLAPLRVIHPDLRVVHLPGDHEDWYHHPQRYVDLLGKTHE